MSLDRYMGDDGVGSHLRKRGISLPSLAILIPTVAITVSELLLFFGFVRYALWAHLVTLFVCVFAPLVFDEDPMMFQVFALIPVFRLVNLGMPVFFELTVYWLPLIYGPIIPAIYVIGQSENSVSFRMGWKYALLGLPLAIPSSAVLGYVEYFIITPQALIPEWSMVQLALISIVMIGFVGLAEELLFRGVLQQALVDRIGTVPGIFLASAIFGLMHSGYRIPSELVFAVTIGLVFGAIYHRTESLLLVTVMHGVLNVFLFAILPLWGVPTLGEGPLSVLGV